MQLYSVFGRGLVSRKPGVTILIQFLLSPKFFIELGVSLLHIRVRETENCSIKFQFLSPYSDPVLLLSTLPSFQYLVLSQLSLESIHS